MSGRNPFLPITTADLKAISREAASDYLSEGTDLTDAVVKAASLFGRDLTGEHVRRVCEMTYHDVFERQHREKTGSKDRYISFDPPDAVAASSRLNAQKVASGSLSKEASAMTGTAAVMDKVAQVSDTRSQRHQTFNAFDALVQETSPEPQKTAWYNPLSEVCYLRGQLKEAMVELQNRLDTIEGSEKFAMSDLISQAVQESRDQTGVAGVLHACLAGVSGTKLANGVLEDLSSDLLYQMGLHGCVLEAEKVASYGEVNRNHPLPRKFEKVAGLRNERLHVEFALSELQRDWDRVNDEVRALIS